MWLVWLVSRVRVSRTGGTVGLAEGTLEAEFADWGVLLKEIGAGPGTTCGTGVGATVVGATGGAGGCGGAIVKRGAIGTGLGAAGVVGAGVCVNEPRAAGAIAGGTTAETGTTGATGPGGAGTEGTLPL